MYRSDSASHSGLQQQQPQRYSDRHRQPGNGQEQFNPRLLGAQQPSAANQSKPVDAGDLEDVRDDHQSIKSYLKKTLAQDARSTKPDTAKNGLLYSDARGS